MENILDYLEVLNPEQRQAVEHDGSSLLILAGAGSGKTRVITTKIAYLISQKHVDPYSILAVTFTKKAAAEMKERAVALEPRSEYAQIRTFHSFGSYFLRKYHEAAGIDKNFTVYDEDDMVTLITKAVPTLTRQQANHVVHKISLCKDYCLTPDSPDISRIEEDPYFPELYAAYQKRLRDTGNVDFGDLIMLPYLVLRDNQFIRDDVHLRYRVIMVDEYQDSNVAQFLLLQELSGVKEGCGTYVCVVGDDDQSIYKFRGAEVQNILNFQKEFPGTELIRLQTNYRSTKKILDCADSVVRNNQSRLGKTLVADRGNGSKPTLVFLPTQDDESLFCAEMIKIAHDKEGVPYGDWAILYRTNAQSLGFETEFLHQKIPYAVVGSLKFYEREEVKDALAWVSFVANTRDEVAFRRIVNKPARGVGNTTQDKIIDAAQGISIIDACKNIKLSKKAREGIEFFTSLVSELSSIIDDDAKDDLKQNLSYFVERVVKASGLEEFHSSQEEITGTQKVNNLQELINSAVLYPCSREGLLEFLDHIELDKTLDKADEDTEKDAVTLITLHNTKGLEFPRVVITGMESGIFPREDKDEGEMEEERRLMYVGITRARDMLFFTSCQQRRMYGRTNIMYPSIFLGELGGKENIKVLGNVPSSFRLKQSGSEVIADPLAEKYKVGTQIYHDDYGHGQIIKGEYSTNEGIRDYVITVSFETGGIKKFLPKYQSKSLMIEE